MNARDIEFRIAIKVTPREVWKALTDPQVIPEWSFMKRAELSAEAVGGMYMFYCGDNPDDRAEILEYQPHRRFAYRWHSSEPTPTIVEYDLEYRKPYTLLGFRNSGFPDSLEWDKWYEANFEGWLELTLALKRMLERGSNVEMNVAGEA